jgi:hypothetical protein
MKRIDENFRKRINKDINEYKASHPQATSVEIENLKRAKTAERSRFYETKRAKWEEEAFPDEMLAFLFCSYPSSFQRKHVESQNLLKVRIS